MFYLQANLLQSEPSQTARGVITQPTNASDVRVLREHIFQTRCASPPLQKLSTCDANYPCSTCESLSVVCTYQRLEGRTDEPLGAISNTRVSTRSQHRQATAISDQRRHGQSSVPFLLNYSAPGNQSNPGDVNHALSLLSTTESNDPELDSALPSLEVEADRSDLFFEDSWALFFGSVTNDRQCRNSPLPEGLDDPEQRQLAADKMIDCLSNVYTSHSHVFGGLNLDPERTFFNERNVRNFINAYFDNTVRPRSRIVLKSSFNLETTSAPLLLSIFLLGASCGLSDHAMSQATTYVDMAEQVVFEDSNFLQLVYNHQSRDGESLNKTEIESIQAAILIILNQLASPKPEARRRVRIQRYPALVSIARATSMTQIKNQWHDSNIPLRQAKFIRNETCIRLMASITMLDCHNIMFFNTPPQFTASEFGFDLPAEERGIDIRDSATWEIWAQNEREHQRPSPLNIFVQELLSEDWPGLDDPRYSNLNVFALFIVVSGKYSMISLSGALKAKKAFAQSIPTNNIRVEVKPLQYVRRHTPARKGTL
ncbi:hypothetical protein N7513_006616 [Penicillium frequentans]|nr:hypothetical protein N7513_006616 [Penicillium glabrum]